MVKYNTEEKVEYENVKAGQRKGGINWLNYFWELPMEFFSNTTLHGLKYVGERERHIVERIFWGVAFIVGAVISYYMILGVWKQYKDSTVIITLEPRETKIQNIPFPAVTICNMNTVLKTTVEKFIRDTSDEAIKNNALYYVNHLCSSTPKSFAQAFNYSENKSEIFKMLANATTLVEGVDDDDFEPFEFLEKIVPSCEEMILLCMWESNIVTDCSTIFKVSKTDYGICCTFNMIPLSELQRDTNNDGREVEWEGYKLLTGNQGVNHGDDSIRTQKFAGASYGLSILLSPGIDEYFCTSSDSMGFRLVTHLPMDQAHVQDYGTPIQPNSEVFVNVRPEVTMSDEETLKSFAVEQRQCYFTNERKLRYYTHYTATNCLDECFANFTIEECKCTNLYMPSYETVKWCEPEQFACVSKIKSLFVGDNYQMKCKECYPACTEIVYRTETTYTPLQDPEMLWTDKEGKLADWANKNVSIVHVYLGEDSSNAKKRKELYGVIDLIANFGGLMGLCLGFSGLSLLELIYFLTLRPLFMYNRCRRNHHPKKDSREHSLDGIGIQTASAGAETIQ